MLPGCSLSKVSTHPSIEPFDVAILAKANNGYAQLNFAYGKQCGFDGNNPIQRNMVVGQTKLEASLKDISCSRLSDGESQYSRLHLTPEYSHSPSSPTTLDPLIERQLLTRTFTSGLDLLSTASIVSECSSENSERSYLKSDVEDRVSCSARREGTLSIDTDVRLNDILCGRGGRSNNHPGNKRFRDVVNEMRMMYQNTETKAFKTDVSRAIVEHCYSYGARFLKVDEDTGKYFVLTNAEARKKTSQALRENAKQSKRSTV